ncbi:haloalkane dehalogenase [Rhodococcus rhodnii LMG 5362]|uniref:Haloalkane dehalogenase n=1 Tax=Rhodococcus rhodnii LMG 5362 TaxID=1273125 RepID=R7WMB4_9NOCA|nr:haloalkane dehalogenase [Rhodococcus rhodnii LMG 5362]
MDVPVGELTFRVDTDGPEDGPPVVLLHGFPTTRRSWRAAASELADRGMRTIVPDQRGYSPGARPGAVANYHVDQLAEDVVGLLDAFGLSSVHLVGHDWGAIAAWAAAARRPDRVDRLTAVSVPHPAAFRWAVREDPDQRSRSSYISLLRMPGKAEEVLLADDARRLRAMYGTGMPAENIDDYLATLTEPGALTAALNWYRAMDAGLEAVPPVRTPTTFVWASDDAAIGRAGVERCHDFVAAPYRFVELTGSHWVPEEQPAAMVDAIVTPVVQGTPG